MMEITTMSSTESPPCPFLDCLPIEIRLKIYELAVAVEQPIHPQQQGKRSNTFFRAKIRDAWEPSRTAAGRILVATQLSLTCRTVYRELAAYPLFYEVNEFSFDKPAELLAFLVALTPARRAGIRTITIQGSLDRVARPTGDPFVVFNRQVTKNVIAMLSKCTSLRRFNIEHVTYGRRFPRLGEGTEWFPRTLQFQCEAVQDAVGTPLDGWTFLSLPMARIMVWPGSTGGIDFAGELGHRGEYVNGYPIPDALWGMVRKTSEAFRERQKRITELHSVGEGVLNRVTPSDVDRAIAATKIDLPGEARVLHNRFETTVGNVSSRTRTRCQGSVDSSGVINTCSLARYSVSGTLIVPFSYISGIRWSEEDEPRIECLVAETTVTVPYGPITKVWEFLDSIEAKFALYYLRNYYDRVVKSVVMRRLTDRASAQERLTWFEQAPSPETVIAHIEAQFDADGDECEGLEPRDVTRWARLQEKWLLATDKCRRVVAKMDEKERKAKEALDRVEKRRERLQEKMRRQLQRAERKALRDKTQGGRVAKKRAPKRKGPAGGSSPVSQLGPGAGDDGGPSGSQD